MQGSNLPKEISGYATHFGVVLKGKGVPNGLGPGLQLHLTPKYVNTFCKDFNAGRSDMNTAHITALRRYLSEVFQIYRNLIDASFFYTMYSDDLPEIFSKGDWTISQELLMTEHSMAQE